MPNWNLKTGGKPILDSYLGLSPTDFYYLIKNYGETGRIFFIQIQIIDTLFPFIFNLFLAMGITKLINLNFGKNSTAFIYLGILPLFGMIFDYLENISFFIMVRTFSYPNVGFGYIVIFVHYGKMLINIISVILLNLFNSLCFIF